MLAVSTNKFHFLYSNLTISLTPGTAVTPGASNAEGSWTQIATSGNIAQDIYLVTLWLSEGSTATQQKDHLLDIGVDPAGGTSYTALISDIVCGEAAAAIDSGRRYVFPIWIKAGSSVAVRIQGSNATAGAVNVVLAFYGQPSKPHSVRVGQYAETIGTITGSGGVAFTPGNSGSEGAWTSLGTTVRDLWWWQIGFQISNSVITQRIYYIDLAYGDATNKVIIIQDLPVIVPNTSEMLANPPAENCFCGVPGGSTIYIRGTCSGTASSGSNAVAVGIGG